MEGKKFDKEKLRWSLLDIPSLKETIQVLEFGAKKYSPENWKGLEDGAIRYYDAAMRHLTAWKDGEIYDPESGLPHLGHAACCVMFVQWFSRENEKNKAIS